VIAGAGEMGLRSSICEGWVRHRRYAPRAHGFTMPVWMVDLDLSEIDEVFSVSRWWSKETAPVRFDRGDYLDPGAGTLDAAVRDRVEQEIGVRPRGAVRMLTHLRQFGYLFNPVTFYSCFGEDDEGQGGGDLVAIVAEITNTPWGERHAYVLDAREGSGGGASARFGFAKAFHVSPFLPMDLSYDWVFSGMGGGSVGIHMNLEREGGRVFDATLKLKRTPMTAAAMRRVVVRYPLMTARVIARIHLEALKLWVKGVPVQAHPGSIGGGS
jgi:hypothetical protein